MSINRAVQALTEQQRDVLARLIRAQSPSSSSAWTAAWDEINAELRRLERLPPSIGRSGKLRILRNSRITIRDQLLVLARRLDVEVREGVYLSAMQSVADQDALVGVQLPPQYAPFVLNPVPADALAAIVARSQEQVTVLAYRLSDEATRAMSRHLRLGVATGANPREAARRMVSAVEGEFNGGLARAEVIARTEMLDAYRAAAATHHDANADLLKGWTWLADLSERTCPSCLAMNGTEHPLSEDGPLDHQQGRCQRIPTVKSWREIGIDKDEPPAAVVPDAQAWLADQPVSTQREILGPARLDAWKDGQYPPSAWSERRTSTGWRDSYHTTPAPPTRRDKHAEE